MAENDEDFPFLIPLIWQLDGNVSPSATARMSFYGAGSSTPLAVWGGTHFVHGGDSQTLPNYIEQYTSMESIPSPMEITIGLDMLENTIFVSATVQMLESITTTNNKILFLVSYHYDDNIYWDFFASVVRYNEQNFDLTTEGQSGVFEHNFSLDSSWEHEKLNMIVIVQSFTGEKTIYQSKKRRLDYYLPQLGKPTKLLGDYEEARSLNAISLSWNPPTYDNTEFLGYRVYKDNIVINDELLNFETTNFIDTEIIPAMMYYYYITALYTDGESTRSNIIDIYTDNSVPPPILGPPLKFDGYETMSPNGRFLIWDPPIYESATLIGYKLYRNGVVIKEINNTYEVFYTDSDITEIGLLQYYATAVYTLAESKPSSCYTTIVHEYSPPILGAPLNFTGTETPDDKEIYLTWETPEYAYTTFSSYRIYKNQVVITEIDDIHVTTFTDRNILEEGLLVYYATAIYADGESEPSQIYETYVFDADKINLPSDTMLGKNYPNPFNPNTTIHFELHRASAIKLDVYNVKGQFIISLIDDYLERGVHKIQWMGKDENGQSVSSGVYFYRLKTDYFSDIKQMILLK